MIKGVQKNPYKCMNVIKQDAMDDKWNRNMQNMWKIMYVRGSQQIEKLSSSYRAEANLNGSNSYQVSIEQT